MQRTVQAQQGRTGRAEEPAAGELAALAEGHTARLVRGDRPFRAAARGSESKDRVCGHRARQEGRGSWT